MSGGRLCRHLCEAWSKPHGGRGGRLAAEDEGHPGFTLQHLYCLQAV